MNTPILMQSEEERAPWNHENLSSVAIDVYVQFYKKNDPILHSRNITVEVDGEGMVECEVERYLKKKIVDFDYVENYEYDEDIFINY